MLPTIYLSYQFKNNKKSNKESNKVYIYMLYVILYLVSTKYDVCNAIYLPLFILYQLSIILIILINITFIYFKSVQQAEPKERRESYICTLFYFVLYVSTKNMVFTLLYIFYLLGCVCGLPVIYYFSYFQYYL